MFLLAVSCSWLSPQLGCVASEPTIPLCLLFSGGLKILPKLSDRSNHPTPSAVFWSEQSLQISISTVFWVLAKFPDHLLSFSSGEFSTQQLRNGVRSCSCSPQQLGSSFLSCSLHGTLSAQTFPPKAVVCCS